MSELEDEFQDNEYSTATTDQTVAVIPGANRSKKVSAARFRPKKVTKAASMTARFGKSQGTGKSIGESAKAEIARLNLDKVDGADSYASDLNAAKDVEGIDNGSDRASCQSDKSPKGPGSSSIRLEPSRSVVQTGSSNSSRRRSAGSAVTVGGSTFKTATSMKETEPKPSQPQDLTILNGQNRDQEHAIVSSQRIPLNVETESNAAETLVIPPALPGEKSLKDFCSKFKDPSTTKKKRGRKIKALNDNVAVQGNDESENTDVGMESLEKSSKLDNEPRKKSNTVNNRPISDNSSTKNAEASGPVVELVDGEIVIRESSLVVGGGNANVDDEYEEVHEGAGEMTATYTSFTNRTKRKTWTAEETILFFDALRQIGPDFSMMNAFFVDRDRRQLRNKYKNELKKNPLLVQMALAREKQKPIDLDIFEVTQEDVEAITVVTDDSNNDENKEDNEKGASEDNQGNSKSRSPTIDVRVTSQKKGTVRPSHKTETPDNAELMEDSTKEKDVKIPEGLDDDFAELNDNVVELVPLPEVKRKSSKRKSSNSARPKARPKQKKAKRGNKMKLGEVESVDV